MPSRSTCLTGGVRREAFFILIMAAFLAPSSASASLVFEAFVPIKGKCHWAQINSETGVLVTAWPVDSPQCPSFVNRTKAADGSQLFAVKLWLKSQSRTALWQLRKGAKSLDVLPQIHNLVLGWSAGGAVRAVTENLTADVDPNALQAVGPPETEEDIKEIEADQWKCDCYRYVLKKGAWQPEGGETVETHEGMRGPACAEFMSDWTSTKADYSGYLFFDDNSKDGPPSDLGEHGFSSSLELDITRSGKPCLKACKKGDLLRRYAFSTEWYEGHMLTGQVATLKAGKWQLVEGVEGRLREFFRIDDQLIFCTEKGFGGWDHKSAKRLWWRNSPACPFKDTVRFLSALDGIDFNQNNSTDLRPYGPIPNRPPRKFAGDKTCTAKLWVNKPGGVPVLRRDSPKTEKPIGTLADTSYFTIVSGRKGLVRYKNPTDVDGLPITPTAGLIPSDHVFVSIALRYPGENKVERASGPSELVLYEMPWEDAKHVVRWTAPHPDKQKARQIVDVFGCVGGWLKVKYHDGRKNEIGWLHPRNQCANQRTTCP